MMEQQLHIIRFNNSLAEDFSRLNLAWLRNYFEVEPIDEEMLANPQQFIIDKGGHIFFAVIGETVVGTFALMKAGEHVYELSKMAVDESFQGKNIGNAMLHFCLEQARQLGANKLILFSNTILQPAIHLYTKFGFREVPLDDSEYKRSNIKMEVDLQQ
jgi:ribosomal protein S18 acetylase RimI-like enzyme